MGPSNGIVGDNYGTDLPESQVTEQIDAEVKNSARFSKTKEFQQLKSHLESRMDYYQRFLPGGEAVIAKDNPTEVGAMWIAANCVIGELQAIISAYEQAAEVVKKK